MANFTIPENTTYESNIRKFETTDKAHASLFNSIFQTIINNISHIKKKVDEKILFGPENTNLSPGSILFVTDVEEAVFSNIEFSSNTPLKEQNWGQLEGKLTVAEEPEPDTVFFVPIHDKE